MSLPKRACLSMQGHVSTSQFALYGIFHKMSKGLSYTIVPVLQSYCAYVQSLSMNCGAESAPRDAQRSPITTHMLDTALGKPAQGVPVRLLRMCPGSLSVWEPLSSSATNADGRVPDLLPPASEVAPGIYR